MKKYLLGLTLALFILPVKADWVAVFGGDWVTATDTPCYNQDVLAAMRAAQVPPEYAAKAGSANVNGQEFQACYVIAGNQAVFFYEDGDMGFIPLELFKKLKDA